MNKTKLCSEGYLRVMVANFSLFFAFYLLTPLLPLYLSETFGATKDVIGLVLSGYTLTALVARPISGYLVDTFSRKRVLMVCYAVFAVFFAGYLAASSLLLFTIVRTLHGGPFGAVTVANSTVAINVLPAERRAEGIGYYGLSNNVAMALAPTVALFVYHHTHNFHILFWIAFAIAVIGLWSDSGIDVPIKRSEGKPRRGFSWDRLFLLNGWLLGVNMIFFGFCFGVLSNYLAIYGKEVLGITGSTGTFFLLCSMGLILSRLEGSRSLRKGRLSHNAMIGMLVSLLGYTLFALSPLFAHSYLYLPYFGSAFLIGLGNGHLWPAFQNMIISVAQPNRQGTANSTILVSWDIGMGLGVLAGGVVAEQIGYTAAFWTVVGVNAVGVLLFFAATKDFYLKRRDANQ